MKDRRLTCQIISGVRGGPPVIHRGLAFLFLTAVLALFPSQAGAQLKSNAAAVSINATLASSITITAAPGNVNFTLVRNGTSTGNTPITISTSWDVPILFGTLTEYAFFNNSAAALTDGGGDNIPSASVSGSVNGGAYTAFTGTSPFGAGSSLTLFNQTIFIIFSNPGSRNDTLNLRINTNGLNLPAASYTGVLHIVAQAT